LTLTKWLQYFLCLLIFAGLVACTQKKTDRHGDVHLTATLDTPTDITLSWSSASGDVAAYAVEYANDPKGEYTILKFLAPSQTTFKHPNLVPETNFYYRVRPLYGPASRPLEFRLSPQLSNAEYVRRYEGGESFGWAQPKILPGATNPQGISIKGEDVLAAAPTNLNGIFMPVTVSGFQLSWTDNSSDEDGYLMEMKPEGGSDYEVQALLPPDINAFGYALTPPARKALVRVRAFYFGKPSNLESKKTGLETPAKS
jgi:hypothetical protein